ncbi:hypothetical protein [Paenibacillus sp. SI8]|uniref:hypothetical protein n=1 Tax=unclassified Paenibacillus TaxID=185978 RepID=UPI003466D42E
MAISNQEAIRRAKENWLMWRLLLSDMSVTYSDVSQMDHDDLMEANAALDIHIESQKKKATK